MTESLAGPFVGMLLLTGAVWIVMFIKRVSSMSANAVDVEDVRDPQDVVRLLSPEANAPSNNLKNLFELPVIFYAVCLYLMVAEQVDSTYVTCAWIFLGSRVLHSLIHCSYNRVLHRFIAYLIGGIALWVMVVRAALALL